MVSIPTTSTNSTQSAADTYAQLHEYSGRIRALSTVRKAQYKRGDVVTAVICLTCAIATVEPATNQWLKTTPVGQFFGSIKVEQVIPKVLKPEAKPQPQSQGEIKWTNPLPGGRITSRFSPSRKHPKTGKIQPHEGLDISVAPGAPVVAAKAGTVVGIQTDCVQGDLDCGGGYGNWVEIDHADGYTTLYTHLQKINVKPGQSVNAGDVIGEEGNTGRSTAAHLHFEIRQKGKALDPEKVFPAGTWEDWK